MDAFLPRSVATLLLVLAVPAGPTTGRSEDSLPQPLGPGPLATIRDGERPWAIAVLEMEAHRLDLLDPRTFRLRASRDLCAAPRALAVDDGSKRGVVACGEADGRVLVFDLTDFERVATIAVGHTPSAMAIDPCGETLYVCNRFDGTVSVVDLAAARTVATWRVGREPIACRLTPDGRTLVVGSHMPDEPADRFNTGVAVWTIDTATAEATRVRLPNGAINLRDICLSRDGRFAYVTHVLGNYELVTSQVSGGWINMNAVTVVDVARRRVLHTIGLDQLLRGAANPWGLTLSPDGRLLIVAHAGTSELSVLDLEALHARFGRGMLAAPPVGPSPNDPGVDLDVRRRIPLPLEGVRHVTVTDEEVVATGYFSDSLAAVPLSDLSATLAIPADDLPDRQGAFPETRLPEDVRVREARLGPPPAIGLRRRGEMLFHDATICYQHWQSCASCHPDGRADGLNWDLVNDGVGNPKNTKSLLYAHRTPPAMALGVRPTAEVAVRAGLEHILFAQFEPREAEAIDAYLRAMRPVASPRLEKGRLSQAARRGKRLFHSAEVGCAGCHSPPLGTDRQLHDVGTRVPPETKSRFDTPALVEVWRTAPYLHDGRYTTIDALLRTGRHGDPGGRLVRLSEQDWNDLIEYVMSM